MQLVTLMVLLMLAGNPNFAQIKPLICQFGGEEAEKTLQQAEELSQMLTVVSGLTSPPAIQTAEESPAPDPVPVPVTGAHPLDPISAIADERILTALSQYICMG